MSIRDLWVALGGARKREVRRWQHTLAIAQAVYNWGGPRPKSFNTKPLGHMHQEMFPEKQKARMSMEEYRAFMAHHDEAMRKRNG